MSNMKQIPRIIYGKAEHVPVIQPQYDDVFSVSLRNKDTVKIEAPMFVVGDTHGYENREKYTIYVSHEYGYVIFDAANRPLLSFADGEITIDYVSHVEHKNCGNYHTIFHFLNSNVCLKFFIKDLKYKTFPEKLLEEKLRYCVIDAQNEMVIS